MVFAARRIEAVFGGFTDHWQPFLSPVFSIFQNRHLSVDSAESATPVRLFVSGGILGDQESHATNYLFATQRASLPFSIMAFLCSKPVVLRFATHLYASCEPRPNNDLLRLEKPHTARFKFVVYSKRFLDVAEAIPGYAVVGNQFASFRCPVVLRLRPATGGHDVRILEESLLRKSLVEEFENLAGNAA